MANKTNFDLNLNLNLNLDLKSKWFYCLILLLVTNADWCLIKAVAHNDHHTTHTFQLSSLLPFSLSPTAQHNCTTASSPIINPKGRGHGISLEVRHMHGPCSTLGFNKSSLLTHDQILQHDKARVDSLRHRINHKPDQDQVDKMRHNKVVDLPAKSGSIIGTGNFFVTLGLGTPRKDLSLVFDTGSEFTWTQCEPCVKTCYQQQDPIFDPRASSTYSNISCTSPLCSYMGSATGVPPGCAISTCIYGIQYGDSSSSVGFFAKDTLHLGAKDVFPSFLFGCGEDNQGLFQGSAGIIGLARSKLSLVSQTSSKYKNYFSYCLPSKTTSTGHLTFGAQKKSKLQYTYTPILTRSSASASMYFIELDDISVGGQKLGISPSVFSAGGTIIDSGTVITRLPPDAYTALQTAFSQMMSEYPKAPSLNILDTCYDFSNYTTVSIPKISLLFGGGAHLDLGISGVLYVNDITQVCLGFAGNSDPNDVAILGNVQQLTFDVVYDVAASRIGFAPAGCV